MECRNLNGLSRPFAVPSWMFVCIWVAVLAFVFATVHWLRWIVIFLPFIVLVGFGVVQVRVGKRQKRHFIWTILTTRCPQCGTWPLVHKGSANNHGFMVCEKCQVEWDLGGGLGSPTSNFDPAGLMQNISEIIDKHIQTNDPPVTRQTMDRLIKEGHMADEVRKWISMAAMVEVFHIYCDRKPFDPKRYAWNLARLPQEPWDAGGREIYIGKT